MSCFHKLFLVLVFAALSPVAFVGCGPSQVSEEGAAATAQEEDPIEDADDDADSSGEAAEAGDADY